MFRNQKLVFVLEEEIVSLKKEKEEYSKLNEEYKIHDLFSLAVSKKGIPTMLINSCLPLINKEISDILSGVTNFKIEIAEDDKGNNLNYLDHFHIWVYLQALYYLIAKKDLR